MYNITHPGRLWFFLKGKIHIIIQPVLYQSEIMETLWHLHMIKFSTQDVGKILNSVFFSEHCFPPAWTYSIENM